MTGLAGAVLAGGASRRFGRDKAFHLVDGRPMVVCVAAALAEAGADPVTVIGGDGDGLLALGLSAMADRWPGEGPLGGLLTALEAAPTADIVVVAACDLPQLDGPTVRAVVDAVSGPVGVAAAVADPGRVQPLLGAWRVATVRAALAAAFADGVRSMEGALAALSVAGLVVRAVPVPASRLVNVNRVDDLAR